MTLDRYDDLKQRILARGPALAPAMTEADLVDDLGRLLREGVSRGRSGRGRRGSDPALSGDGARKVHLRNAV